MVWTPVNSVYKFCIIPEEYFINNSLFMITGAEIEFLCVILNSKLYQLYFNMLLSSGCYTYGSKEFFNSVPIININNKNEIKELYYSKDNCILNENEINNKFEDFIYNIYKLSKEEINYINEKISE